MLARDVSEARFNGRFLLEPLLLVRSIAGFDSMLSRTPLRVCRETPKQQT